MAFGLFVRRPAGLRQPLRMSALLMAAFALSGCVSFGGTYSEKLAGPPATLTNTAAFEQRAPVIAITFVSGITPSAEKEFEKFYNNYQLNDTWEKSSDGSEIKPYKKLDTEERKKLETAVGQMISKTSYHAVLLSKHIADKEPTVTAFLDPVKIDYDPDEGFFYKRDVVLPPRDLDIDIMAYVHPRASVSNYSNLITTNARYIAPIVNIRSSQETNEAVAGAVALPKRFVTAAVQTDGFGARATLIEYFNSKRSSRPSAPPAVTRAQLIDERPLKPGTALGLPVDGLKVVDEENDQGRVIQTWSARHLYQTYLNMALDALNVLDFQAARAAQMARYTAPLTPANGVIPASIPASSPKAFVRQGAEVEVAWLTARDEKLRAAMMAKDGFVWSMAKVAAKEDEKVDEYIAAQIQGGLSILAAIGGAYLGATGFHGNNAMAASAGVALMTAGIAFASDAHMAMQAITGGFEKASAQLYQAQTNYTIKTHEGEVVITAASLAKLREGIKGQYQKVYYNIPLSAQTAGL